MPIPLAPAPATATDALWSSDNHAWQLLAQQPEFQHFADDFDAYRQALHSHWAALPTVMALTEVLSTQRRLEGELLSADASLAPAPQRLLERLLENPDNDDEADALGQFSLALRDNAAYFPLHGAVAITTHPAELPGQTSAPLLLLLPGQGLMAFADAAACRQQLTALLTEHRQQALLLDYLALADLPGAEHLRTVEAVVYRPLAGNALLASVQALLARQAQDLATLQQQFHGQPVPRADIEQVREQLQDRFSVLALLAQREQKLFGKTTRTLHAQWLADLGEAPYRTYRAARQRAEQYSTALSALVEHIPDLQRYTVACLREALARDYPGCDLEPERIKVSISTTTQAWSPTLIGAAAASLTTTATRAISLVELALENLAPWTPASPWSLTTTAISAPLLNGIGQPLRDAQGQPRTLDKATLEALIRQLDIGARYPVLLEQKLAPQASGGQPLALRQAWTRANAAAMAADAVASRLNPAALATFSWQSSETPYGTPRGLAWIEAILGAPGSPAIVDGHPLTASYLQLGAANPLGGGSQLISGVLLVGPVDRLAAPALVLYTPDAPDGIAWRELGNGLAGVDQLLGTPGWKAYFSARMASNDPAEVARIFDNRDLAGSSSLLAISGDLQEALYRERCGFLIAHADYRSTSNAEVARQATFNKLMFGFDLVDLLLGFIPFAHGLSLWRGATRAVLQRVLNQGGSLPWLLSRLVRQGPRRVRGASALLPSTSYNRYRVTPALIDGLSANRRGIYRGTEGTYVRLEDGAVYAIKADFKVADRQVQLLDPKTRRESGVFLQADAHGRWQQVGLLGGGPKRQLTPAQAEAQARLKKKRMEWKQESEEEKALGAGFTKAEGGADLPAYRQHLRDQMAIEAGFSKADGSADYAAFKKDRKQQQALNAGFRQDDGRGDVAAHQQHLLEQAALREGMVNADGSPDLLSYGRLRREQKAIKAGFFHADGSADTIGHDRYTRKQTAIRAGFTHADGSADLSAYYRHSRAQAAANAGFFKLDGSGDLAAYYRDLSTQAARRAGFIKPEGSVDLTAYNRHVLSQKALKENFVKPDGSADLTAYRRSLHEQAARKAGFGTADGGVDTTAYNHQVTEQRALRQGYVDDEGNPDLPAYWRHVHSQTALNAGFVQADGSADPSAYRRYLYHRKDVPGDQGEIDQQAYEEFLDQLAQ